MNPAELRTQCANRLEAAANRTANLSAFVGLDGFVDTIVHLVDTRVDARQFHRLTTIPQLAQRIAAAAGKSTNIELVNQLVKLGGNGPIMANALASFGLRVTYLGALGYPNRHPVFDELASRADVHSIAPYGATDALEFDDGKVMLTRTVQLNEITWANIQERFGRDRFAERFQNADLTAFVNWTMIPFMSDLWQSLRAELVPALTGPRRRMFFDLCDPAKRLPADIRKALDLIASFQQHFDVILGLNEKESQEIGEVLGLDVRIHSADDLARLGLAIASHLRVDTVVIHPVKYALAISGGRASIVDGPFVARPKITTGAGDHFNAGFCLGRLLGLDDAMCVLTGVTTSGHYVRTAQSPTVRELVAMLRDWPSA